MNKKELWEKFMSTGKISDYIRYKRAMGDYDGGEDFSFEAAEELYPSNNNPEDYGYDLEDGRYSNP